MTDYSRDYLGPEDLVYPSKLRKKTLSLSGSTAEHQQFPINFKTITIQTDAALFARFDNCAAVEASPGDVSDTTKDNVIPIPVGTSFWPINSFVNTVSLVIDGGSGNAVVHLIPGEGKKSGLSGAGIDWDEADYS